jgi:SNF2 family DNA or RNA helicase
MAGEAAFRVCLRLNVPAAPEDSWRLEYLLQARDDPSLLVEAEQVWRARGKSLQQLGRRFENPQENLLGALGYAAQLFPPLEASLHTRRPSGADLDSQQAYRFLREAAPLLEQSGFGVFVPPWWNRRGARLGARLKINSPGQAQSNAGQLSLDKLVSYNWEIVLGEQTLSREEFKALVKLKMPLMKIRGQWVVLDPRQIEAAIRFWEKQRAERQMDTLEAVSWGLNPEGEVGGLPVEAVEVSGWLAELLEELQNEERLELQESPPELAGELRPYQQRGFSWLAFMRRWGLGACLADDMGLGKTIQAIALFLHARQPGQRWGATPALPLETPPNGEQSQAPPNGQQTPGIPPGEQALVVCPTSVAGNWQREIERFAPQLKVLLHHGGQRAEGEAFLEQARQHDVVITSYGLARRDVEALEQLQWGCLVLDEAQNIKNPSARQTQAVRRIPARFRLALTGTPVENRLLELWSIMQFLNPGYLGSQKKFRSQFGLPIERYHDPQASQELRQQVGPFILRRLKTNPAILQDLPEKMEMKVYCNLTEEQASLYQVVVDESLASVEAAEAEEDRIQRSGLVLSMLLKLKQVCNHPALFLGDQSGLAGRSGKLERLEEMLEEALSVGDKALIFTQFASMGGLLKDHLQERFGREVLFLHGGTPRPQRERMLARFQDGPTAPPVFILSLKAGGVGLNLTAANHVFHFDRWWNPAVEQQATDRAFRIGQTRNVQVHKFICTGTLEENIDLLIEGKKALAESVIQSSESWLTELSTQELRQVIRLRPEAVGVA